MTTIYPKRLRLFSVDLRQTFRGCLSFSQDLFFKVSFIEVDPFGAALVHVHDFGVVQTKKPQDRGMKIVDMHLVFDRVQS